MATARRRGDTKRPARDALLQILADVGVHLLGEGVTLVLEEHRIALGVIVAELVPALLADPHFGAVDDHVGVLVLGELDLVPLGDLTIPMLPKVINSVDARRLRSPLRAQSNEGQQTNTQNATSVAVNSDAGPLANQLRPLELAPSVAGQLGNRNFLITQGTMIDCVMQTRLVTAQAGMLTCNATRDVMSANGKVVLIDAGTKFVGYQSGGIVQGQPRAFVTWHRLETPTGVILNLGSPGTGSLGEAGVDGAIDHHFWDRLGNAILLSLLGDLGSWASNQGNKGDGNIRFDNTREGGQEVVAKILEHSLDIPPTLYKNQGERVGIMVARDLDFSKVYELKPTYTR